VLIGGGTYNLGSTPMRFSDIHGSAGNPVVITAELGQTPIFDGSGVVNVNYPNEPFISFKDSSYLYLDGFEIFGRAFPADVTSHLDANGRYTGPTYEGGAIGANGSFLTIARMKIHQIPAEAVSISGSDIVIACNQITDVVLGNKDGNTRTGHGYFGDYWPSTIMTWIVDNGHGGFVDWTRRVQYIKNSINGSWGEGLNCLFVDGCDVIGNEVADTYSVMIYMDHARNVRVIGNRLHDNGRANGNFMSIDNEGTYGNGDDSNLNIPYMRQDNILIANNFFGRGGGATIFRYDNPCPGDGCTTNVNNTWSNVRIINNIFSGGSSWSPGAVMDFAKVTGPTAPTGGVISGNIFLNSGGFNLGNPSAWIITNNDFFGSAPSITQGANVSGTLSVDPQFTGPTDGSSWAGLTPRNTAALQVPTLSDVTQDALGQSRNSSMTTAGPIGP
jgi:hypothetical protein